MRLGQVVLPLSFPHLLLVLLPAVVVAVISDDLVVETTKGRIRGTTLTSATGRQVSAFYGVPYAQPPVGDLRFRHPRPADRWDGVKDTVEPPNSCIQIALNSFPGFAGEAMWNPNTAMSEDCLYLNVVVPRPHPRNAAVLVWIHGGGFWSGTSTLDVYDMRTLAAEENVILVSMQYRVASLSFMFFGTDDVPGNAGMFDQVMALQWVKDNIAQFGGSPDKITLMGQSAGAVSVGLHLLSPLSRNLFSQAIMQSASATAPWGIITKEESVLRGLRLAELMGCPHDRKNIRNTIDCLRRANATRMVYEEWNGITHGLTIGIFTPIIDGSFLEEKPETSLMKGNFKKTNILMGANKDEGNFFIIYYLTDMFPKEEKVYINREDFKRSVQELNIYSNPLQKKAIEFEYTNWLNPEDPIRNRDAVDKLTGDWQFTCPVVEFAHKYAEKGNNVYMYYFTQRSSTSAWPTWSGVLHADEIPFVFGVPLNETKGYSPDDIKMSKKMMTYWANFVKTGNPSLSEDRTWTDTYWPLHTPLKRETLVLNSGSSQVLEGLRVNKCAFWRNFLPQLAFPRRFTTTTEAPVPATAAPTSSVCRPDCCWLV